MIYQISAIFFFLRSLDCEIEHPQIQRRLGHREERLGHKEGMVLWEITLATAYFLGLRRTYRLALKLQRPLISPNYPKTRKFVHKRIRGVFDVALKVYRGIQEKDVEVGRNLGNWVLRWLDHVQPSANIRGDHSRKPLVSANTTAKYIANFSQIMRRQGGLSYKIGYRRPVGSLLPSPMNVRLNALPMIGMMMMRSARPGWLNGQYRHMSSGLEMPYFTRGKFEGVFRRDIMQWMMPN